MFKFIRIIQLKIEIEGKLYENLTDIYLRCENIPILQKTLFIKIANQKDNRLKSFNEQCRERRFFTI